MGINLVAIVCQLAIHHFPQPEGQIREMACVLKAGGRLVIADLHREFTDRDGGAGLGWDERVAISSLQ